MLNIPKSCEVIIITSTEMENFNKDDNNECAKKVNAFYLQQHDPYQYNI